MDKIMNSSVNLCTKCFKFLQRKHGTCSVACSWTRSTACNTDGNKVKDISVLSRKTHLFGRYRSRSISNSRSMTQTQHLLPSRYIGGGIVPCSSLLTSSFSQQQSVLTRQVSTDSPNPLPPRKKSKDNSQKSPVSWRNLMIVAGIGGTLLVGMTYVKKEKEREREKARNLKMGKAKLGGDWTLIDHHGNLRSSQDFRGQWLLIYFGFTNCPDICPEEIEKIVSVIGQTDADADLPKIQPIIITVDPDRDTPDALKEYCAEFSSRLLGFSGSQEQIRTATRAYRVYFSQGPKDEDNDYIVDHSIISYLVNPNGDFVDYFGQNKKDSEMFKSIKLHILSHQRQEK